ncbi:thyroid receptor-interacting protein 11 [Trichonephila clavipes]|nr:thyroid receptor-interacting protein 11 [Trichonephila clavipes]
MSWLGDQINTFTEKLTDFTKEVLIENRTAELTEEESKQNDTLSFKELADLCREKDRKIESLMQEKENLERSIDELDQQHREIAPQTITQGVSPVCLGGTVWLQAFPWRPSYEHTAITGTKAKPTFLRKQQISTPSSDELRLETTDVTNSNGLESVEYTLEGAWLRVDLELADF